MKNQPKHIAGFLRAHRRFLIVCHPSPDGDMLGSAVALSLALKKRGKTAVVYSKDALDDTYGGLPHMSSITHKKPQGHFDAVITLDCGDIQRLMPYYGQWLTSTKVINIDHHKSNSCFGDYVFVDTKYAAVGEQMYLVIKALGVPLDADIAFHLYLSIMTDTGNFRFASTSALTFKIASELVRHGVNPEDIYSRVYENRSKERMKLLGLALNALEFYENNRVVVIPITKAILNKTGEKDPDTQDVLDVTRMMKNARVILLLKQKEGDEIKVSLRSPHYDMNRIATKFGGGGHHAAAGCNIFGKTLKQVQATMLKEIKETLRAKNKPASRA